MKPPDPPPDPTAPTNLADLADFWDARREREWDTGAAQGGWAREPGARIRALDAPQHPARGGDLVRPRRQHASVERHRHDVLRRGCVIRQPRRRDQEAVEAGVAPTRAHVARLAAVDARRVHRARGRDHREAKTVPGIRRRRHFAPIRSWLRHRRRRDRGNLERRALGVVVAARAFEARLRRGKIFHCLEQCREDQPLAHVARA